ncbi:MAG: hypothetical protein MHM6MM_002251 [Cercozoa sp. M6MM]
MSFAGELVENFADVGGIDEPAMFAYLETDEAYQDIGSSLIEKLKLPFPQPPPNKSWIFRMNKEVVADVLKGIIAKRTGAELNVILNDDDFASASESDVESQRNHRTASVSSAASSSSASSSSSAASSRSDVSSRVEPPTSPLEMTVTAASPTNRSGLYNSGVSRTYEAEAEESGCLDDYEWDPREAMKSGCLQWLVVTAASFAGLLCHVIIVAFAKSNAEKGWPAGLFPGLMPLWITPFLIFACCKSCNMDYRPYSRILMLSSIGFGVAFLGSLIFGGVAAGFMVAYERQNNYVPAGAVSSVTQTLPTEAIESRGYFVDLPQDIFVNYSRAKRVATKGSLSYTNRVCVAPIHQPGLPNTNYFMTFDAENDMKGNCNLTSSTSLEKVFRLAMEERSGNTTFMKFVFSTKETASDLAREIAQENGFSTSDPVYTVWGRDPQKKQDKRKAIIDGMLIGTLCFIAVGVIVLSCWTIGICKLEDWEMY